MYSGTLMTNLYLKKCSCSHLSDTTGYIVIAPNINVSNAGFKLAMYVLRANY